VCHVDSAQSFIEKISVSHFKHEFFRSDSLRDDLTVQVIFFGKEIQTTGNVTVNKEASAPHDEGIKPKL
jgi:hypothetical protein